MQQLMATVGQQAMQRAQFFAESASTAAYR